MKKKNSKKRRLERPPEAAASSKTKRTRKVELKDMTKLGSNDECFHLSRETISDIINAIRKQKTPSWNKYRRHWDEYAISFYLKMCDCFDLDYQHLEAPPQGNEVNTGWWSPYPPNAKGPESPEAVDQPETEQDELDIASCVVNPPNAKEMELMKQAEARVVCSAPMDQPNAKEMSYEGQSEPEYVVRCCTRVMILKGPFEFGSYSPETAPERIPYNLYRLVKEVANIKRRSMMSKSKSKSNNDLIDLERVEKKIWFFCKYFRSHLPTSWNYTRRYVRALVAHGYDTMGTRRCLMDGYTPFSDFLEVKGEDEETFLSPKDMAGIMSVVHSRKTPSFWGMAWPEISFYYNICCCFGIDYHCLEAASEDDVCLLKTGEKPLQRMIRVNASEDDVCL